jgi:pantetheine-phosphate adenylyltransferase
MVNNLVCGGTFDHFHKGHREFLRYAFSIGKKNVIGLTSNEYIRKTKNKKQKTIEDYEIRRKSLEEFLLQNKVQDRVAILKIDDLFGSTLSKDYQIDAIVVSKESEGGANIINQKRKELNLPPLKVFIAPFVKSEDEKIISSERLRKGEINREGRLCINPLWLRKDLILPEDLKNELKKPFGKIVDGIEKKRGMSCVITVGDATTKRFNDNRIGQNISAVDFMVARKEAFFSLRELGFSGNELVFTVSNPASHIMHGLLSKISEIFGSNLNREIVLKITGEEDLVVLPLILAAPLGTIIYYGQPDVGLVKVLVSENSKKRAYNLVTKFRPI